MKTDMNRLGNDEHVCIVGMTGCGKTVLAEVYMAGCESVIKVDTKQEYDSRRMDGEEPWRGLKEGEDYVVCRSLDEVLNSEWGRIIYVVPWHEQEMEYYDRLFQYCFEQGDTTVWVDEVMTVCESPQRYSRWLKAILTAGRSRRVRFVGCTQRPTGIPGIIFANTTHFFVFALNQPQDRKKMVDVTGCMTFYDRPEKYYFYYYKDGMDDEDVRCCTLVLREYNEDD